MLNNTRRIRVTVEGAATALIAIAAIGVGGSVVHREFSSVRRTPPRVPAPTYMASWRDILKMGVLAGDPGAPIKIVEFADLECPYCKRFHTRLAELRRQYQDEIAVVYVHYPLPNHRFARAAARAAECADAAGRFTGFLDLVYAKQDSLGLKTWSAFAAEAGIRDTARFSRCASSTAPMNRVDQGVAFGKDIGILGTPTVIINGWRFAAPPYDSLPQVVARIAHEGNP
jgi:protein-disulfide isomerase